MTQLNPNITTAGATLAKNYRKVQGGKMAQKTAMEGKRCKDGREPTLNIRGSRGAKPTVTDPEEAGEDVIDRHARGFMRDVQRRSKGIHKRRND